MSRVEFYFFTLFTAPPRISGGNEGRPRYVIFPTSTDPRNVTLICDIQPGREMGRYDEESWQIIFPINGSLAGPSIVQPSFTYNYTFTIGPSDDFLYQCRVRISHNGTPSSVDVYTGTVRIVSKGKLQAY